MAEQEKIKRSALTLMVLVGALVLGLGVNCVRMLTPEAVIWSPVTMASFIVGLAVTLAALAVALLLLASIRTHASPFTRKNAGYLKIMGVLLVVFEGYAYLAPRIIQAIRPIGLEGGLTLSVQSSLDGVTLAAGLVMYAMGLIFQYGVSLQEQADETL